MILYNAFVKMENGGGTKRSCWGLGSGWMGPRAGKAGPGHSEEQMAHLLFRVTPFLLPLAAPVVPWPSGNSMAGPGSPARPAVIKWERDEDIFPPYNKRKSLSTKKKHQ